MIRLFVALDLPDALRAELAAMCHGVRDARWVAPDNIHLTLRFIGEVDNARLPDIVAGLKAVRVDPLALALAGAGHFETRRRVHTLWIGVDKSAALDELYRRVESALVRSGLDPERRKFSPHVTLARLKPAPPPAVADWLTSHALFRAPPFTVERFVLYSSFLGGQHAIHTPVAEFPPAG